jgi:hypothetical protein
VGVGGGKRVKYNMSKLFRNNSDNVLGLKLTQQMHNNKVTKGRAIAQAVIRRPLNTEAPGFDPRSSPCEIYGGQSSTRVGFSPSCRFSPFDLIPLVLH